MAVNQTTIPFPAYAGRDPFVFVCHSHSDATAVYAELIRLRDAGINIWYDEGITPGSEWTEELANAIRGCAYFLYYVSPASVAARNCRDEVQLALKERKRLVSVHIEPTELPGGLELAIGSTQAILRYRFTRDDYERKLLAALRPAPVRLAPSAPASEPNERPKSRRGRLSLLAVTALLMAAAAVYFVLPPPTLRITEYKQITKSRVFFSPFASPQALATDGARIYFNEWHNGDFVPREVSVNGGESARLTIPDGVPQFIRGVSHDRSELVLATYYGGPLWLWSSSGLPRRVGTLEGHDLSWSENGHRLVNLHLYDITVANADGSEPKKIYSSTTDVPVWARLSRDGAHVRFTANTGARFELWEVSADGTDPHPLLPNRPDLSETCCGSWTPDGQHYVFQATRNGQRHIWVLDEDHRPFAITSPEPRQLTTGAMHFIRPLVSPDGKRLFALGWHLRGEAMRYDATSDRFVPHFGSRSVEWMTYTADGQRVAYITYPEGDLWTSAADGSNAIQLTQAPMHAVCPAWSPDDSSVAFLATLPHTTLLNIYLVRADGVAQPQQLTSGKRSELCPTWSHDGTSIAFGTKDSGIRTFDLRSKREAPLAGGERMRNPKWSKDGRYLTAVADEPTRIMLFEAGTGRWEELALAPQAVGQPRASDGQSVFYLTEPPGSDLYRVRIADRHVERVLSLKNERWVFGAGGIWVGFAPDGSPLYLHDRSIHHIYALDLET